MKKKDQFYLLISLFLFLIASDELFQEDIQLQIWVNGWVRRSELVRHQAIGSSVRCNYQSLPYQLQREKRQRIYGNLKTIDKVSIFLAHKENNLDDDWRAFRAKLVLQQKQIHPAVHALNMSAGNQSLEVPSTWVFELGHVLERGALLVSQPAQDFGYGGLHQHYLHKSIVLIVDHNFSRFTKGLLLNRLIDQTISCDDSNNSKHDNIGRPFFRKESRNEKNQGLSWPFHYGGHVEGIDWEGESDLSCVLYFPDDDSSTDVLQSWLETNQIQFVLKGIYYTSWEVAIWLVQHRHIQSNQIFVFCGYVGWSPGQLQDELKRDNWIIVSMESNTLIETIIMMQTPSLATPVFSSNDYKYKNDFSGITKWNWIMETIGRSNNVVQDVNVTNFQDAMLHEWAITHLRMGQTDQIVPQLPSKLSSGCIVCSSFLNLRRPPFWPDYPVFVHSILLILVHDDNTTIGALLNRPTSKTTTLTFSRPPARSSQSRTKSTSHSVMVRYGGRFGQSNRRKPLLWFHCGNEALVEARVGSPVAQTDPSCQLCSNNGVWVCTQADAETALTLGIATVKDFMAIEGVSIWNRSTKTTSSSTSARARHTTPPGSLDDELRNGRLHVMYSPTTKSNNNDGLMKAVDRDDDTNIVRQVWNILQNQTTLTNDSLDENLNLAKKAWSVLTSRDSHTPSSPIDDQQAKRYCNQLLAEEALRRWTKNFFL